MSMVADFFMAAGGAAAGYVIVGLAAALGKLIVGAVLRFRFDEFVFFMIRVARRTGTGEKGLSFGLCDPQPFISCNMLDTRYTKMRNLIYGAFSMAAALFFTETVWFQLYGTEIMPKNAMTQVMAVVMAVYTLVLFFQLCVSQKKKAGNGAAGIMRREYERCIAAVTAGQEPGSLQIQWAPGTGNLTDSAIVKKYLLMCYYHFLDRGEYEGVKKIMDEYEKYVPEKWTQSELNVLCEFVFYHVIIVPNEGKAKYYGKPFLEKLDGREDVNVKRAFAYWLFFVQGDKGAALQIAVQALKLVKSYHLEGCRAMEERLLEALIKKIEQTP
mgnify:CR=1 FL=1